MPASTGTTSSCSRRGRRPGSHRSKVAYEHGLVEGVFVLKDMADATGAVAAAESPAGGRSCSAPGCSGSRSPPGWRVAASRCASCTSPTGSWSATGWEASEVAVASLARLGITTHVGASVAGSRPGAGGRGRALRRRPRGCRRPLRHVHGHRAGDRARPPAGLTCDRGVVVDDDLRCPDDPNVYAIGDCAQPPTGATGLVAQGWQQASRLVARLTDGGGVGHGRGHPRRRAGQGVGHVDGSMGVCGWSTATTPATGCSRSRTPSAAATPRSSSSGRAPRRCHLPRRRRRRRHAVGPLHPLAAGARRPGAAGGGARRRRHGIRREAPRGAADDERVHLQLVSAGRSA